METPLNTWFIGHEVGAQTQIFLLLQIGLNGAVNGVRTPAWVVVRSEGDRDNCALVTNKLRLVASSWFALGPSQSNF